MNCPYAATASALDQAPLAGDLPAAYPAAINRRYRSIEDPATVRSILAQPEHFSPSNALATAVPLAPAALRILSRVKFALPEVLASASGPEHLAVRRITAGFFSPAKVRAQRERVQTRVREICAGLDTRLRRGEVLNLGTELAAVIPVEIMARMTGLPVPPRSSLKAWSQNSLELFWGWPDESRQLELARSAAQYYAWLDSAVHEAVLRDDENLCARLHQDGVPERQLRSLTYFLGIAGQETTSMLISTALHVALRDNRWSALTHPDMGIATARQLIGEVLSRASSVPTWRRIATSAIRIEKQDFRPGDELVLRLSGGDLGAAADASLAFGHGIHRCLGAGLARMEAELALAETARSLPALEADPKAVRFGYSLSFQAPDAVLCRYPNESKHP